MDQNLTETLAPIGAAEAADVRLVALAGVPAVEPGDDLAGIIVAALAASGESLRDGDILVLAQKIVSKAQGRAVPLASVAPSDRAKTLAQQVNKDPRLIELILRESSEVVRSHGELLIVAHCLGFVMANAGIDFSNVAQGKRDETALLLPEDPDRTCAELRAALRALTGADVALIINDSHGRAFRNGTVGVAIGVAGMPGLADLRGRPDLYGRTLHHTQVGLADEVAAAASLLMGQAGEGRPIVLVRGVRFDRRDGAAAELVRPKKSDLFREPSGSDAVENALRGRRAIRRYLPRAVPGSMLERFLFAATCAPSAHNRQPWRFAVLTGAVAKQRLAGAMGERLRADRFRDGDTAADIEADVARSSNRIVSAPVVVVVSLTLEDMDRYPDERRRSVERQMAVQSTAMAMQNMLLAASAAGLGANIMCAPAFCPDTVRAVCALPESWEPQALITLGYPAEAGRPFKRRDLCEVIRRLDDAP